MEKLVLLKEEFLTFPKRRVLACHAGPQGKHQLLVRQQKQEQGESLGHSLYWGFFGKGKAGQSKQLRIG